jgi:DNA-directed RNA polymerase specialized sigma24 family protein
MFFSGRNCGAAAEELADRTFDRVIQKLEADPTLAEANPSAYVFGVARKILQEYQRQLKVGAVLDSIADTQNDPLDAGKIGLLARCLARLTDEERTIITDYYAYEKQERIEGRRHMASDLPKPQGALRIRAYRIRRKLRGYMDEFLGHLPKDVTSMPDRIRNK